MNLTEVPDIDLHAEVARRESVAREERIRWVNEHYGPCPECNAGIARVQQECLRQHRMGKTQEDSWLAAQGIPLDPMRTVVVASEWETIIVCQNGHERVQFDVKRHDA